MRRASSFRRAPNGSRLPTVPIDQPDRLCNAAGCGNFSQIVCVD
jgi:hypothetical protein